MHFILTNSIDTKVKASLEPVVGSAQHRGMFLLLLPLSLRRDDKVCWSREINLS
jgi:hypothetical protein